MKTVLIDCLLVGTGGFAGAVCRYGIAATSKYLWDSSFPVGTLIANVLGCFLIGLLIGSGHGDANKSARLLFGVGFLGALTTFSTFGAETVGASSDQQHGIAIGNVLLNLGVGLPAVVAGMWLGKKFSSS